MRASLGKAFLVLGSSFSPFRTYHATSSGLWSFCWEISWQSHWVFICMLSVLSPLFLLIFIFVFNFCQFDYYVAWHIPSWVYPAWDSLNFLDLFHCFFSHVGEFFSYYLFKYFRSLLSLFSFWNPYNVNVGAFNIVPEVP